MVACSAACTRASRPPKSNSSHCSASTDTVPWALLSLDVPSPMSLWPWPRCQPVMAVAARCGRYTLLVMPVASAALRAAFQAMRVRGLADCARSMSSACA
ncbi:hypothetical protein G6F63_016336 [Rhizopus arrhizus]|nr:hypothetical protein G6F63_016336 [Rhizopus arrhizus]